VEQQPGGTRARTISDARVAKQKCDLSSGEARVESLRDCSKATSFG
jgi:hypothetical protein